MPPNVIRSLYHTEPFRAFRLHFVNGKIIDVPARDRIAISSSGKSIAVVSGEVFEFLNLDQVTSIDVPAQPKAARKRK